MFTRNRVSLSRTLPEDWDDYIGFLALFVLLAVFFSLPLGS